MQNYYTKLQISQVGYILLYHMDKKYIKTNFKYQSVSDRLIKVFGCYCFGVAVSGGDCYYLLVV